MRTPKIATRAKLRTMLFTALATTLLLSTTIAAPPAEARSVQYDLDIPSQNLNDALQAFALASQHKLLYSSELVNGKRSPALKGQFTTEQAVKSLLAGTNLNYEVTSDGLVLIRAADEAARASTAAPAISAAPAGAPTTPKETGKQSSQDFRVAQVDQGKTSSDAAAMSQNSAASSGLSEIIVTAEKRSERLQDVPSSITALSQNFIQNTGAQQLQDLVQAVPGLAFEPNASGTAVLSIRGVNTSSSKSNLQSPVALYVDEVPVLDPFIPWAVPRLDLFDVNRAEILRGPQGTLFGSGALGGAIRIVTNKPDMTDFQAVVEQTLASRDAGALSYSTSVVANLPLIANVLAVRFVGFYDRDGGWIDNPTRGESDVNSDQTHGGRVELRFAPTENFNLTATFSDEIDRPRDSAFTEYANKNYTYNSALPQFANDDTKIYNIVAEYQFPAVTLTSSSSYVRRAPVAQVDATALISSIDGLPVTSPVIDTFSTGDFLQEIRIASSTEHPYKWLMGAYLQNYHLDLAETVTQAGAGAVFAPLGFPSDILENDQHTAKVVEEALFGEASYDLLHNLTVTLGARAFHESVGSSSNFGNTLFDGPGPIYAQNAATYNKVTPKLVISYTPIPDVLLYAQEAQGYRSGQGNLSPAKDPISGQPIPATYGPDELWNTELGAKTLLLDHRLTINVDIYSIDWKDIQLQQHSIGAGDVYTANAGRARIQGSELEVIARPIEPLELGTSLSFHHARLTSVAAGVDALVGDRLPGSAPFTGYVYGQYTVPFGATASGFARLNYSYTGKEFSDLNNPTSLVYGDYSALGAQLGLHLQKIDLLLFGENLNGGDKLINAFNLLGNKIGIRQTPRTVGVTFRARY